MTKILLGYEVGTGKVVHIDPDHLLGTGLTQQSGKTTMLNALISRSGRRAIAFRTKRGEIDWTVAKQLQPYYKEPKKRGNLIDWQYVKDLLEAAMERGLNFEEAWIIRACDNAKTLRDVYENIQKLMEESKRGIDQNQYLKLEKYFEIILPQLEARQWASTLPLVKGVNLMDLEPLTFEMQCLVIERTMDHVIRNMKGDIIIVLPEARKFIPLHARTPVTATAIKMASEGAVLEIDLWVDSQTYSSINNEVRKQCGTQLHGVQMDNNEAKTVADLLDKNWNFTALKKLKLGHFFVKTKDKRYKHVYMLPAGIPKDLGKKVALGEISVNVIKEMLKKHQDMKLKIQPAPIDDPISQEPNLEQIQIEEQDQPMAGILKKRAQELERLQKVEEKYLEHQKNCQEAEKIYIHTADALRTEKTTLETDKKLLKENLERVTINYNTLEKEHGELRIEYEELVEGLRAILGPILKPLMSDLQVDEKIIEKLIDRKINALPMKQRRRIEIPGDTGIPWVDMWLPKLKTPREKKIIILLANKIGTPLTKDQIALATGYSVGSGSFNSAISILKNRYKLIKQTGDTYTIVEAPV